VTDFDNAIDRDPFAAAPYQARGESLVTLGNYDKAIEDFNAALNVDNKSAPAWAWLGLAYERKGERVKAHESYQRALSIDPSQPIAKQGVARG
jgi:tetratricopeptide (TPR) repeat protein